MAVKTDREKLCSLLGLQNLHVGNIVGTGHVERDIVLPILSVCLSNAAVLCQNKRTVSDILVGTSFCCFLAHLRHKILREPPQRERYLQAGGKIVQISPFISETVRGGSIVAMEH